MPMLDNKFIFQIIAGKRMELITTPLSPPSQGGDKVEVKNLLKLVLMKLVLVKTGNGERRFLLGNTIKGGE